MKFNAYFIIILIFCFFICLNSAFAISNETNDNQIHSNDKIEITNYTPEIDSKNLKIPTNTKIEDNQYDSTNNKLSSSKKIKTKIIANDKKKYYGEKITIKAKLKTDNNKGNSKKKITINCDGKTYTKKTDSNGKIKLVLNNKAAGKYSIIVT